jgi:hypothetical protein
LISTRMATPKGAHMMGGEIVEGSGVDIDASLLEPGAQWTPLDFVPDRGMETNDRRLPLSSDRRGRRRSGRRGVPRRLRSLAGDSA